MNTYNYSLAVDLPKIATNSGIQGKNDELFYKKPASNLAV
jgi:hypothetical protein